MLKQANTPVLDQGLLSRVYHWLRPKPFWPVERMNRVLGSANKKAGKMKRKEANGSAKKRPNFGLCACIKYRLFHGKCDFLIFIYITNTK